MLVATAFSRKLDLVLKALSLSRGRLAAQLGVDKSLAGRWASGAVTPSAIMPGMFRHEFGMFRQAANGLIAVRMGCAGYAGEGWLLPLEGKLFSIIFDVVTQTPLFEVYNGVQQSRAISMNGLMMGADLDVARTPTIYPTILDRSGDLTGDEAADEATYLEMIGRDPMAPPDSISDEVRAQLVRDIGPAAAAAGGDLFLTAAVTAALARGEIGRTAT